jgi:putative sigma-54 modulation protein
MQFSVTFRHMDASDAVRNYAREKIDKIKKYVPDPIFVHFVVGTERGHQHHVDVHIQLHNGLAIKGRETTEDMYSSIDLVMDKIERQVRRYKEKIRHHKSNEGLSEMPVLHHVLEGPADHDGVGPAPPHVSKLSETKTLVALPLTPEEAVMQADLAQQAFLVFRNADTGQINVVYRREDGVTFGLIETQPAPQA